MWTRQLVLAEREMSRLLVGHLGWDVQAWLYLLRPAEWLVAGPTVASRGRVFKSPDPSRGLTVRLLGLALHRASGKGPGSRSLNSHI